MRTISILVKGKVQGVNYRQSTRHFARETGITGEVWNNEDGTVGIIATGTNEQLDQLIAWCHKGPPLATVTSVEKEERPSETFQGFSICRRQ